MKKTSRAFQIYFECHHRLDAVKCPHQFFRKISGRCPIYFIEGKCRDCDTAKVAADSSCLCNKAYWKARYDAAVAEAIKDMANRWTTEKASLEGMVAE
jgi:hypothetical protein